MAKKNLNVNVENLLNGRNDSIDHKLDDIRSQNWGYDAITSSSQAPVFSCPSNKIIHLQTLSINNDEASALTYIVYDSTNTATPVMKVTVGATDTLVLTELKGLVFSTGVYIAPSSAGSSQFMAAGIIRSA